MKKLKFLRNSTLRISLIIALFWSMMYFVLLIRIPAVNMAKLKVRDFFYTVSYKNRIPSEKIKKIVIISLDDDSAKILNKRWPWARSIYGQVIDSLSKYKPKVIGMDIAFLGESQDEYNDQILSRSLKKAGNVFLASYFNETEQIKPHDLFSNSSLGYGFVNVCRDSDLYLRRSLIFYSLEGEQIIEYSFSLKIFLAYLGLSIADTKSIDHRKIKVFSNEKEIEIPIKENGTMFLNYIAKSERFTVIPIWRVLKENLSEDIFKGNIVLVGAFSEAFKDIFHTPLGLMPGVVVLANQLLMMLDENFVKEIIDEVMFCIVLIVGFFTAIFNFKLNSLKGAIFLLIEIFILELAGFKIFYYNYVGDFFAPVVILTMIYLSVNFQKYGTLLFEHEYLKKQAITDELTGLFTYRYFQIALRNEFSKSQRYKNNFGLAIFDVDHFKSINDTYGHKTGNIVLQRVADIMKSSFRRTDTLARFGGDEFCIIISTAEEYDLLRMAEKLRKAIEETRFREMKGSITISIGLVLVPQKEINSPENLFESADLALYKAKEDGRNRCMMFNPDMLEKQIIKEK